VRAEHDNLIRPFEALSFDDEIGDVDTAIGIGLPFDRIALRGKFLVNQLGGRLQRLRSPDMPWPNQAGEAIDVGAQAIDDPLEGIRQSPTPPSRDR
jgi:hypothetical protein